VQRAHHELRPGATTNNSFNWLESGTFYPYKVPNVITIKLT